MREKREKRAKRKKANIEIRLLPVIVSIFLIVSGAFLVALSYIKYENEFLWWKAWGCDTSRAIGTTLIASAVVSILLEMSTLKDFVKNVLKNILDDEFPLDAYSKDNLENFQKRLVLSLCEKDGVEIDRNKFFNSIYFTYEEKMRESALDSYYEYHDTKYDITPDTEKGIFSIKAELTYKIVNLYETDAEINFKAKTYSIENIGENNEDENAFVLEALEIDDKAVKDLKSCLTKEQIPQREHFDYYDYKIKIYKKLGAKKEYKIKMCYRYNIPITDSFQSYKVTKPCKRVEHRFRMFPDVHAGKRWKLKAIAFAAYFNKQGGAASKFKVEQNENDVVKIMMNEWVFPGSGYVVVFEKEE